MFEPHICGLDGISVCCPACDVVRDRRESLGHVHVDHEGTAHYQYDGDECCICKSQSVGAVDPADGITRA